MEEFEIGLLTVVEAAAALGATRAGIHYLARSGALPVAEVVTWPDGRLIRYFAPADVEACRVRRARLRAARAKVAARPRRQK